MRITRGGLLKSSDAAGAYQSKAPAYNRRRNRPGSQVGRPALQTPTVMASPPTVTFRAVSTITTKKTWALTPPVAPSAQAGPAILHGSLTFGRVPAGNGSYADLAADAAVGATTVQIGAKTPSGALATGSYRIEPQTPPLAGFAVADHLAGENITITAVTGASAPYTATLSAPLAKAHPSGSRVATTAVSDGYNITNGISGVGFWTGDTPANVLETDTDGPTVSILCKAANSGNTYRLWVDGQLVTATEQTAPFGGTNGDATAQPSANAYGYLDIVLGSRQMRRIRFESTTMFPAAIITAPADSVSAPANPSVRALWISDSFLAPGPQTDGIAHQASRLLGWDAVIVDQIGGTGYVAASTYSAAPTRLAAQIAAAPDVVVIALGLNDSFSGSLQATVTTYLNALRAGLPNAAIYVVGPWSNGNTTNTGKATVAQALQAAAAAAGATFIDTMLGVGGGMNPWIVGTGTSAAPNGTGNADALINADATHPNTAGQAYIAARIAQGVAASWDA